VAGPRAAQRSYHAGVSASTPAPPLPHVVVIMTDQHKATAIDLYGGQVRTPYLSRLARQGLLYEHAFRPHPLCVPARVALWTGRWPHNTGAHTEEFAGPAVVNQTAHQPMLCLFPTRGVSACCSHQSP
jgi:hypothetical protein